MVPPRSWPLVQVAVLYKWPLAQVWLYLPVNCFVPVLSVSCTSQTSVSSYTIQNVDVCIKSKVKVVLIYIELLLANLLSASQLLPQPVANTYHIGRHTSLIVDLQFVCGRTTLPNGQVSIFTWVEWSNWSKFSCSRKKKPTHGLCGVRTRYLSDWNPTL